MLKLKFIFYKEVLSKCLLTAALVFCIFTLPVFGTNAETLLLQKGTTELVYSNIPASAKQIVSYKVSFYTKHKISLFFASSQTNKYTLLLHNNLAKIQFHQALKILHFFKTASRFIKIKTIPQNAGTDIFSSLIG